MPPFLAWFPFAIAQSTMNDNLEALLFLLRLPCLLIFRIFYLSKPPPSKPSTQSREAALKRIESNEPTPLPKIRPRTLTLTTLHQSDEDTAYYSSQAVGEVVQRAIPPFFKLPLEVRQMIYTEVLGGETLHILRQHKRLGFLRCRALRPDDCPKRSCLGGDGVWTRGLSGKVQMDGGVLSLPLVSRRMYVGVSNFPLASFIDRLITLSTYSKAYAKK